jgi:hypothetical protein
MERRMNAKDIKSKLSELQSRSLEKLSQSDLKKLDKALQTTFDSLDAVEFLIKVEELLNSVPLEYITFYQYFWKKSKNKRPKKNANKVAWEKYYLQTKKLTQSIQSKKGEYLLVFDKLLKIDEDTGLRLLAGLTREDRKVLSILGSVTVKTSRGVSSLVLSENSNNNRRWIQELKKVNHLGVL